MAGWARRLHSWFSYALLVPLLTSSLTGALWTVEKHWRGTKPPQWLMKWHQGDHYFGLLAPANETFVVDDGSGPLPNLPLTRYWRYAFFCAMALVCALHFGSGLLLFGSLGRLLKLVSIALALWRVGLSLLPSGGAPVAAPTQVMGVLCALHIAAALLMLGAPGQWPKLWSARRLHRCAAWLVAWPVFVTVGTGIAYRLLRMHGFQDVKWLRVVHVGYFTWLHPVYPLLVCAIVCLLTASGLAVTFLGRRPKAADSSKTD